MPNLPAAYALEITLPRVLAVAPVKINMPLFLSIRLFDIVVLERQNDSAGEGECGSHIDLETILNILRRIIEERLPNSVRNIKQSDTDGVFRLRKFCVDSLPGGRDVIIRIGGDGERHGLERMRVKITITWGTNA